MISVDNVIKHRGREIIIEKKKIMIKTEQKLNFNIINEIKGSISIFY